MGVVKKYAFWVCVPLGLVVAVLLGMMAVGDVGNKLEDRKKQLDSQKSAVESLRGGATNHPNQGTIDEINEKRGELVGKIYSAWETMVAEQQKQNRWKGLANNVISEIERKNFLDPLTSTARQNYLNFARDEIKKLLDNPEIEIKRVRIYRVRPDGREEPLESNEPVLSSEGGGGTGEGRRSAAAMSAGNVTGSPGGGGGGVSVTKGKVVWGSPRVDITMKNWFNEPQSYEVWLTQEDLWVHQALLWVVAESNKASREASRVIPAGASGAAGAGGSRPLDLSDSVIKEIVEMAIGRKAASELSKQSSRRVGSGGYGGGDSEFSDSSSGSSSYGGGYGGSSSDEFGGSSLGAEAAMGLALTGRYVDDNGTPLMEADLTGQFRRMPVYLRFVVDQRRIADVLANCANCPMPIDVLWVTINPDATGTFEFASATGSTSGSEYSGSSGSSVSIRRSASSYEGGSSGSGGILGFSSSIGGGGGAGGNLNAVDYGADAVTIDIYGCINIFAPPDKLKIAGESAGE